MPLFGSNVPARHPYNGQQPGYRPPGPPQKNGGFGGLISKFLGSTADQGSSPGPPQGFGGSGFQGGLYNSPQRPPNKEKWLGMIKNAQKGLSIVETVGPLVQQYGPIVKNLPSILAMLKEFQNDEGDGKTGNEEALLEDNSLESPQSKPKLNKNKTTEKPQFKGAPFEKKREVKKSVPKLYI